MGFQLGSVLKPVVVEPKELRPGESATLINVQSFSVDSTMKVVAMGVTQHPESTYTYIVDGVIVGVPVPLGTFVNPLYCCQSLGAHIDFREEFKVIVRNGGKEAHKYAAILWYIEARY